MFGLENQPVSSVAAETADGQYRALLKIVGDFLERDYELGPFAGLNRNSGVCSQDPMAYAYIYQVYAERGLADARWATALDQMATLLAAYGFTDTLVLRNVPGGHDAVVSRPDGAKLMIGSGTRTVLTLTGACHVAEAASATHDR